MAYSVQADVQNAIGGATRLVEEFDWDRDGTADPAALTDCIAEADAIIDSFAGKLYAVPFNPVPSIIRLTSARLAVLCSVRRRGMFSDAQQVQWDGIAGTETGKEGWLFRLSTGVVTPGGDPPPPKSISMIVDQVDTAMPDDRDASRDKLGGYW
jgi:hypothetical protein